MKKQALLLIVIASSLFFMSCKKDGAFDNMLTADATGSQANGQGVPFKGTYTTVNTITQPPPNVVQSVVGTGEATHLGSSTFVAASYVTVVGNPPFAVHGTKTFTAANGDQFFTTFTGTSMPIAMGVTRANLVETITGGTGRFANATGSFTTTAIADQVTPKFTATMDGRILFR